MDRRYLAAAAAVIVLAWLFRYQPMPTAFGGAVLDRWTGSIYIVDINAKSHKVVPAE